MNIFVFLQIRKDLMEEEEFSQQAMSGCKHSRGGVCIGALLAITIYYATASCVRALAVAVRAASSLLAGPAHDNNTQSHDVSSPPPTTCDSLARACRARALPRP